MINASLAPFDEFATAFSDSANDVNGLLSELTDQASALKEQLFARAELLGQKEALERQGAMQEAAQIVVPDVDRATALQLLSGGTPAFDGTAWWKFGLVDNEGPR